MKKGFIERMRRGLAMALCLCMLGSLTPHSAWAEDTETETGTEETVYSDGLCPHHTEHTEDCGYVPGEDGTACGYVCDTCDEDADETAVTDEPKADEEPVADEKPVTTEKPEAPAETGEDDAWLDAVLRLMEDNYREHGVLPPAVVDADSYLSGIAPAAFLDSGIIPKAAFAAMGLSSTIPMTPWDDWSGYDVAGGFSLSKFPDFTGSGYNTVSVTVKDAALVALGLIRRTSGSAEEKETYIYYMTTDQNESEISAMFMPFDTVGEIKVNYSLDDYDITYQVMLDGEDVTDAWAQSIFNGSNAPRTTNGSYSFSVTIPYGYTARVYRYYNNNGTYEAPRELTGNAPPSGTVINDGFPLGSEPKYVFLDNQPDANGSVGIDTTSDDRGPAAMTVSAIFNDDTVKQNRHIVVELTEHGPLKFDASQWVQTGYAKGRGTAGTDNNAWNDFNSLDGWNWTNNRSQVENISMGDPFVFVFQTNDGSGFMLDSLELNGVALSIPVVPTLDFTPDNAESGIDGNGTSGIENLTGGSNDTQIKDALSKITYDMRLEHGSLTEATLPDGARVTLEYVRVWRRNNTGVFQRVYKLTITGAKTNVTVTGGNMIQGTGAGEFIPETLVGVTGGAGTSATFQAHHAGGWTDRPVSDPVVQSGAGVVTGDDEFFGCNIRFKLEAGYEDPRYTWNGVNIKITPQKNDVEDPVEGTTVVPLDDEGKIPERYRQSGQAETNHIYGPDSEGYYYIRLEEIPTSIDTGKLCLLTIIATAKKYMVRYMVGTGEGVPDDDNVENMPEFSTDEDTWGDVYDGVEGEHHERYDDFNGSFYDRQTNSTVSISEKIPTDKTEKLFFQYWVVVDENEDPIQVDGSDLIIYPNTVIQLKDYAGHGVPLGKDIGGSDNNYYVIRLKAVWAETSSEFSYEVHLRWVDKGDEDNPDGVVHPVEGEDWVYRVIDSKITGLREDTVTVNIDSADILNWLARNPTYSLNDDVNNSKDYEGAPEYKENNSLIATPEGNYQYTVRNGGQINIWLKEDRGALSFSKTVVGDNACSGEFDFTVTGPTDFTGTVYAWPQNVTWAASNAIQIYFDKGVAKLKVNYENGVPMLVSQDGKPYNITYGVTMFVPEGEWTLQEVLPAGSGYNPQVNGELGSTVTVPVAAGNTDSVMNAFVNTVTAYRLPSAPVIKKKIVGDTTTSPGGTFTFKLMPAESDIDNVEIIDGKDTISIDIGAGDTEGEESFGGVIFKAAGTYYFTIREESFPGEDGDIEVMGGGYTPVKRARNWRVTVVNDNGTLKVSAFEIGDEGEQNAFDEPEPWHVPIENTWQRMEPGYCYEPLKVTKVLTGRTLRAAGFEFEASVVSAVPDDGINLPDVDPATGISTATNGSRGDVGFGWIEFTKAGTYVVKVVEKVDPTKAGSVDYDEHELRITYNVVQRGDKLVLDGDPVYVGSYSNPDGSSTPFTGNDPTVFTNAAFVELPIVVTKEFGGDKNWEDETFTATISITGGDDEHKDVEIRDIDPETGAVGDWRPLGVDSKTITFTKNPKEHTLEKFDFRFKAEGVYTFTVQENNDGLPGITYDDAKHLIVVTVTDANGKLAAAVTVDGVAQQDAALTLHNIYSTASVSIPVSAYKDLEGATLVDHQFSFVLEPWTEGTAPEPAGGRTSLNEADGDILWNITFRSEGEYVYKLYELADSVGGITYDTGTVYQVVVNVTEDEDTGALNTEVKYRNADGSEITDPDRLHSGVPVFINYAYVDVPLNIYKILDGRDWEETDQFVIRADLIRGDGTYVRFDNDEEVKWPYELPALTSADPLESTLRFYRGGTYVFELTEVKGNIPGVSYDTAKHRVTVVVTDAISRLSYEMTVDGKPGDSVTFTNYYGLTPASVALRANVEFRGGMLKSGMFKFELTGVSYAEPEPQSLLARAWDSIVAIFAADEPAAAAVPMPDPDVVPGPAQTVMQRNNGSGLIDFGEAVMTEPGVYTYTVKQIEPDGGWQDNIVYDKDTRTITVNVTRQGHLLVYEAYDEPLFINRIVEPTTAAGTAPGTGDDSQIGLWVSLMVLLLTGLLTVIPLSKKVKLPNVKDRRVK